MSLWKAVTRLGLFAALWLAWIAAALPSAAQAATVRVFAASSLTEALQAVAARYTAETGVRVVLSFGASSAVARQIEAGAPADLFFSADTAWMDYAQSHGLIRASTRRNLLGNRLVLIAPATSRVTLRVAPGFPLAQALGRRGRLAMGDPDSVPVGRYARSALMKLGVWNAVANRLVRAENVRSAMVFVARGEVPLGIVYRTDALVEPKVRVVDVFPASTHPPIVYPVALTRTAGPGAAAFLAYASGPRGQAVFRRFGFATY